MGYKGKGVGVKMSFNKNYKIGDHDFFSIFQNNSRILR